MTESHSPLAVLGRGRPGRAPKNSRNTAALGKGQCAMKTARPRGFRASCRHCPQRRQERQESREPQRNGMGKFCAVYLALGQFYAWLSMRCRKGQAGLAEFWKLFRRRRDLRKRRYCAFLRL